MGRVVATVVVIGSRVVVRAADFVTGVFAAAAAAAAAAVVVLWTLFWWLLSSPLMSLLSRAGSAMEDKDDPVIMEDVDRDMVVRPIVESRGINQSINQS